ncbi:MAG: hypothetical protein KBA26_07265 [Candidatus Delongbacteria bacterium]|nr:hypothetical protein [Candidatus Delongbacteria bacterium]
MARLSNNKPHLSLIIIFSLLVTVLLVTAIISQSILIRLGCLGLSLILYIVFWIYNSCRSGRIRPVVISRIMGGLLFLIGTAAGGALLLLFTWPARFLVLLITGITTVLFSWFFQTSQRMMRWIGIGFSIIALAGMWFMFPKQSNPKDSEYQSLFFQPGSEAFQPVKPPFWTIGLLNLVPEFDQGRLGLCGLKLAYSLMENGIMFSEYRPWVEQDPYYQLFDTMSISDNIFWREYQNTKTQQGFKRLYTIAGTQYLNAFSFALPGFLNRNSRYHHVYFYCPHGNQNQKLPLVIFFHGLGGNLAWYCRYFSEIGNCAVLCPSSADAFGIWTEKDLDRLIRVYLPGLSREYPIDTSRIHLIGMDNGGVAVNLAIQYFSGSFKSFTFLSAWIEQIPRLDSLQSVHIINSNQGLNIENNRYIAEDQSFRADYLNAHFLDGDKMFYILTPHDTVRSILQTIVHPK